MTLDELVIEIRVERVVATRWVESGWILPADVEGRWQFGEADIARARLIRELLEDFSVGEDAVELILSLIDQRATLECRMGRMMAALAEQPAEVRRSVLLRCFSAGEES